MGNRLATPLYLFLLFLTFLRVEDKKPIEDLLNRPVVHCACHNGISVSTDGPYITQTIISSFKIRVRYMGGDCSYSVHPVLCLRHIFWPVEKIQTGYNAPVLSNAIAHLISLRGPPASSVS